ncbi:MAG: FAD-dependent oxidoreductase [Gammaproteobacteria bacterium]|nr:FAD-dependent oxidoreductase [Gammaproteobacteria bacterium]
MHPITIIGSGLAGYTLAREIRKLDKDIALRIITADDGCFYSKPMLSNALAKNMDAKKLVMTSATDMAAQLNMEIITHTRATHINRHERTVNTDQTSGKNSYAYSSLILANGAQAIRIPVAGNAAEDILSINSLHDYGIFRAQLENKNHVTLLGAGLIGCEFANDLVSAGYQVSLIDLADKPLGRLLPEQAARNLQHKLGDAGIQWHLGCSLHSINKTAGQYQLTLNNQVQFNSDLVLSAIGLKADIRLAEAAGIKTGRGIITNGYLQTSDPHIYALGDCLEFNGMVLPFVMPIMIGARALAKTLLGDNTDVSYPPMPVVVKTPAHPVVVCPPPPNAVGNWQEEVIGDGIKAGYYNQHKLLGFALTGAAVTEKQKLVKRMQDDAITDG